MKKHDTMFGFRTIDDLCEKLNIELNKNKYNGLYGDKKINGEKVILAKPQTYMNLSGDFVSAFMNYYKIGPEDIVIVYDDIDIVLGKIRIRPDGSPGTHNGMRDITKKINTKEFCRVRIGTGRPKGFEDLADYVLGKFSNEEEKIIVDSIENASKAVLDILENGISHAMNIFN